MFRYCVRASLSTKLLKVLPDFLWMYHNNHLIRSTYFTFQNEFYKQKQETRNCDGVPSSYVVSICWWHGEKIPEYTVSSFSDNLDVTNSHIQCPLEEEKNGRIPLSLTPAYT